MSSQQRRGRAAVNSTLAVMLVLVAILSPFASAPTTHVAAIAAEPAAQQPAVAQSHAGRVFPEAWKITWNAWTKGGGKFNDDLGTEWIVSRQSNVAASIIVNYYPDGSSEFIVIDYVANYSLYTEKNSTCSEGGHFKSLYRANVTEPAKYNHIGVVTPNTVMPYKPSLLSGTRWTINFVNLVLGGIRTGHYRYTHICGGEVTENSYSTDESLEFKEHLTSDVLTMFNSDDGPVFRYDVDTVFDVHDIPVPYPLHLVEHVKVERMAGCHDTPSPIPGNLIDLRFVNLSLQAKDTTPDLDTTLQARVTCQGVPVENAPVAVELNAVDRSGGHDHVAGRRPRGYIDGVEQTEGSRFLGFTDSDGAVTFVIRPGRDLTDKWRGIAGVYAANAWVERGGAYSPTTERAYINARYDLVNLPENAQRYRRVPSSATQVHPEEHYGTPATVEGVEAMAEDWWKIQLLHNLEDVAAEPWPYQRLEVAGISLPQGGLYDVLAYKPNLAWRTPYRQHQLGHDVALWLTIADVSPELVPPEMALWFTREFRLLGNKYGTWFSEPVGPYHLRMNQVGNLQESSLSALGKSASTDPDVAAAAVVMNPAGRFVAGAGQTVTYAVGVENVVSGTVASQVVLKAALPEGLSFISADPPQSRMQDPRTPVWDIGSLPGEGAPRAFGVVARVDPSTAVGALLTVTATATTSSPDADPANDQFSDWGLTVQPPGPDLVIGSDLSAVALIVSEPVTFTIQLSNEGNAPASNNWFSLTVPSGIAITKASPTATVIPGGVRWDTGVLTPGGWLTATVVLDVDPGLLDLAALRADADPEYPLPFLMAAGSASADIDPASNQVQVDKRVEWPGPDLLVALQAQGTPGPGVFRVGEQVTYTLRYANFGNREAGVVTATLLLWPGLTLIESQPAPTTNQLDTTTGVRTLTWNLGELSVGEDGKIEFRLRVDDVPELGSIVRANISSNNIDLNPADNVVMETRYKAYGPNGGGHKIYLPLVKR